MIQKTLLILLALICAAFSAGNRDAQWHVENKIDLEGALAKELVFSDSTIYFSSRKEIELVALSPVNGVELFRSAGKKPELGKWWESAALLEDGNSLLQIYASTNNLFFRSVDKSGKELFTRTLTLENRADCDNFNFRDSLLIFTYKVHGAGNYKKERTVIVRYDLSSGKVLSRKNSPVAEGNMARFKSGMVLTEKLILAPFTTSKKGTGLYAFDISSGDLVWKFYPNKERFHFHFSLVNESTIILNDLKDNVMLLDLATGKVRKTKSTGETKPVNRISPLKMSNSEVLIGYNRLTKFNSKMEQVARSPLDLELREGLIELDSVIVGRGYESVVLFNKNDLTVQGELKSQIGFEFDGKPIKYGDGVLIVNARDNAGVVLSELWHFKKTNVGYVDLSQLDPGSSLFHEGEFIAKGGTVAALPERDYFFHILGGNRVPYSFRSRVVAGQTRTLPKGAFNRKELPAQQPQDYSSNYIDMGTSFTSMLSKTPDTLWYRLAVERGHKVLCNGVIVADAQNLGLTAVRIKNKEKLWNYNNSALQMMFNFDSTDSKRKSYFEHVTTLPEENLIIGRVTSPEASYLMALDVFTGKLKWVNPQYGKKLLDSFRQTVMLKKGHKYHGLLWGKTTQSIYAIDARTGQFVYNKKLALKGNASILSNIAFHGDTLVYYYTYGDDKYLQWYSIYEQKPLFKAKVPTGGEIVPIPDSDHIYFVTGKKISEYDEKGKLLKSAQLPPSINLSDFVFDDKRVYICSNYANKMHALDRKTFKRLWTYTGTGQALDPAPQFAANGELAIASQDKKIRIVDGATGKVKRTLESKNFPSFDYWEDGGKKYFMEQYEVLIYDF